MKFSNTNNFDLIRLLAASQVAMTHSASHLNYENAWIGWLSLFPGVPVFFFVSGFLIYGSFEKSIDDDNPVKNFFIKRFLRLYPALWLCLILSISLVFASGYLTSVEFTLVDFSAWILTSSTFLQFYNPEFLRGFGVGVINGSLWTIAVELQFYILTPFLYLLLRRNKYIVFSVVIFFCILNGINTYYNQHETIVEKLIGVSFFPWLYMFLIGALTYKYKDVFSLINKMSSFLLIGIYVIVWKVSLYFGLGWGNGINVVGYAVLIAIVLKLAITKPHLSDRLLNRNDISYGIYIFHMPIVNFILEKGGYGFESWVLALGATIAVALISWFKVERPMLRLKTRQVRAN